MLRQVFRAILDFYTLSACSWNRTHKGRLSLTQHGIYLRLRKCDKCNGGYLDHLDERLFVGPRVFADCEREIAEINAICFATPPAASGEEERK